MSMQPLILPFKGAVPRIHESAWIAPNATIIGDWPRFQRVLWVRVAW